MSSKNFRDLIFNQLNRGGLTTSESEDYGSLASAEPPTRTVIALCSSKKCCGFGKGAKSYVQKPVQNRRPFACPDCGNALFYKTINNRFYEKA